MTSGGDADLRRSVAAMPVPSFRRTPRARPPALAQATVAIVTTAGLYRDGQEGWERDDQSFRIVEGDLRRYRIGHVSANFDRAGAAADLNVVFPLDRLAELEADGRIGRVAPRHLSFMGAQHGPLAALRLDTGPAAARALREEGVDVAILTPV